MAWLILIPNVTINDLENRAFENFRKRASRSKRVEKSVLEASNEALLEHLRLFENQHLKRAAILLFHPDPEKYITGVYIKIQVERIKKSSLSEAKS